MDRNVFVVECFFRYSNCLVEGVEARSRKVIFPPKYLKLYALGNLSKLYDAHPGLLHKYKYFNPPRLLNMNHFQCSNKVLEVTKGCIKDIVVVV